MMACLQASSGSACLLVNKVFETCKSCGGPAGLQTNPGRGDLLRCSCSMASGRSEMAGSKDLLSPVLVSLHIIF